MRLAALLLILIGVAGWALGVHRRRARRVEWRRPLHVSVLVASRGALAGGETERWRTALARLERWFGRELARHRAPSTPAATPPSAPPSAPIELTLFGPLQVARFPGFLPATDGWIDRARHALSLSRELDALDAQVGLAADRFDLRLYVDLEPDDGDAPRFVEGAGAQDGDLGQVHATTDEDPSLALAALAHELFHCLGASDKYDADGHALVPSGLVEPERAPRFPQPAAEVMVGEVPLAPGAGRVPSSLEEQRVGPETAREIGWLDKLKPH